MRIVLSGGGTAGHINPALALADVLRERGHEVLFAGTPGGIESRLVPAAGIPYQAFEAAGFNRNHPLTLPKAIMKIQRSTKLALKWFTEVHPDCVVGFGGYVCIPGRPRRRSSAASPWWFTSRTRSWAWRTSTWRRGPAPCASPIDARRRRACPCRQTRRGAHRQPRARKSMLAATRAEGRAALGVPEDARRAARVPAEAWVRGAFNAAVAAAQGKAARPFPDLHVVHVTGPKRARKRRRARSP